MDQKKLENKVNHSVYWENANYKRQYFILYLPNSNSPCHIHLLYHSYHLYIPCCTGTRVPTFFPDVLGLVDLLRNPVGYRPFGVRADRPLSSLGHLDVLR